MSDDGRLELDSAGLPHDSPVSGRIVDSAQDAPSWVGRVVDAALTGGPAVAPSARLVAVGALTVLVSVLVIVAHAADPAPTQADVRGVSARVVPGTDAAATPRVLASYAVLARPGSASVRIVGVRGAGVAAAVETSAVSGTQSFLVDPDCDRLLTSGDGSSYELILATASDARSSSTTPVSGFDGSDALTAAAVQACWGSTASRGLRIESVVARPGAGPWTALAVDLRNSAHVAISVTAVDVANVDTLSMADSRVVEPGALATVRVRLPIARCAGSRTGAPTSLVWSVGPPGDGPSSFATTRLDAGQRATVAVAARARCGPPPTTSVTLLAAANARDPRSIDERGVSITLRLRVSTDAPEAVLLGDDARALTSDARPAFTAATVQPGALSRDTEVVWHTRCDASATDSALTASTSIQGLRYSWSVPITGASLPDLRASACR
jgi:hypothetical protein